MMKNESGRSMVEMLGVLAIIGVLSVGGIAGYTTAMNKYKANEIAAAASQCAVIAQAGYVSGGTVGCSDVTFSGATLGTITANASGTIIPVSGVATGVCSVINTMKGASCADGSGQFKFS